MKKVILNIAVIAMFFAASCSKQNDVQPQSSSNNGQSNTTAAKAVINGIPNILAYYDTTFYTINLMELSASTSATLIAQNKGVNDIYVSEDLSDDFHPTFFPVLSAIPKDGMNGLWHQYIIRFLGENTPHQFFKDDDVNAAVQAREIELIDTGEVYRCSVVAQKPAM